MTMSPLKVTLRRILDHLRHMPPDATSAEVLAEFRRLLAVENAKARPKLFQRS